LDGEVTPEDLAVWDREFEELCGRIRPLFYRPESRAHAERYLRGLLAPLEQKNGWTIAEHVGLPEPKRMQRFLNLTPWDADALRDIAIEYALEHFADPGGVLIADPTEFAKKGAKSAGAQRQYSGTLGRCPCRIPHPPWWEWVRRGLGVSSAVARAGALARLAVIAA
jgi:SRSO17 transposase